MRSQGKIDDTYSYRDVMSTAITYCNNLKTENSWKIEKLKEKGAEDPDIKFLALTAKIVELRKVFHQKLDVGDQ